MADKHVEFNGIRIYAEYIALKIQWYDQIPGISRSDLVYIFYCNNPPQFKIHAKFVYGIISMNQISVTSERHNSAKK